MLDIVDSLYRMPSSSVEQLDCSVCLHAFNINQVPTNQVASSVQAMRAMNSDEFIVVFVVSQKLFYNTFELRNGVSVWDFMSHCQDL